MTNEQTIISNGHLPDNYANNVSDKFLSDLFRLNELQTSVIAEGGQIAARFDEIEQLVELKMKDVRHRRERLKQEMREAREIQERLAYFVSTISD